jgi:hypothetical protein
MTTAPSARGVERYTRLGLLRRSYTHLAGACPEKIDLLSLLFDPAFDLGLNIAPTLRRSAVPTLRDPIINKCPFRTDAS